MKPSGLGLKYRSFGGLHACSKAGLASVCPAGLGGKHKYTTITASRVGIRDEDGEIDQTQSLPPVFYIIAVSLKNLCVLCFCLKPFTKLSEKEGRKHFDSLRKK